MKSDLYFIAIFSSQIGIHFMTDRMGEGNSEGAVSGNFEESSVGHFCEWETNFWSAFSLELDLDDNGEDY